MMSQPAVTTLSEYDKKTPMANYYDSEINKLKRLRDNSLPMLKKNDYAKYYQCFVQDRPKEVEIQSLESSMSPVFMRDRNKAFVLPR